MRIVGLKEFLELQEPVFYSQIGKGGLFKRNGTIGDCDFFETVIVPPTMCEDIDEIYGVGRWGEQDAEARFCVFSRDDINDVIELLEWPYPK